MSEETKAPTPPPNGEPKDAAGDPAPPSHESVPAKNPGDPTAAATPGAPGAPPKAAAPHAPAVPAKPTGPTPEPWNSVLVATLKRQYGSGIREASTYLGQNCMVVDPSLIPEFLQVLRDQEQYDYCVDVTAVHYPQREKQ